MVTRSSALIPFSRGLLKKALQLPPFCEISAFYWYYESDSLVLKITQGGTLAVGDAHPTWVPLLDEETGEIRYESLLKEEE